MNLLSQAGNLEFWPFKLIRDLITNLPSRFMNDLSPSLYLKVLLRKFSIPSHGEREREREREKEMGPVIYDAHPKANEVTAKVTSV